MKLFDSIARAFRGGTAPAPDTARGRNEPCWCGSGQKYKRCHLESDQRRLQSQQKSCCTTS